MASKAPAAYSSLLVTDFSRGWDPTHPDEQLLGAFESPESQQGAAAGAPFRSPDMHDVDFWNGYLNKRNGKTFLGDPAAAAPILGLFMYLYTSVSGTISRALMTLCNSQIRYWNGSVWTSLTATNWTGATYAFFESLKNLLFFSGANTSVQLIPRWWDGSSSNAGYHGTRLSPFYQLKFGANYSAAQISSITGTAVTMTASQAASGLYRGKNIWLLNSAGFMEPAVVASFTTSGTAGTANYYVLTITLMAPLKYTTTGYSFVTWNGCTVTSNVAGGSITIAGALTCIRVLAVTTMKSGGQRASEQSIDVPVSVAGLITLASIQMAFGDGQPFGTDIDNNATTWYMTVPFDPQLAPTEPLSGPSQLFYRIPDNKGVATDTSTGFNPMPNSTTTFTIKTSPNADTSVTLVADTAVDAQGYFTGQVDIPFFKFAKAWQNFLVLFGDIWNPSSIWISAYGAPQVFGTQGGLDGAFIQVPNGNDGQVLVAAYVWRGDLYIFKTNSVYVLQFSGANTLSPFVLTKLQGNFGPVSPGAVAEGDNYLYFLSPLGLCAISGLTVGLLPESEQIRSKFLGANSWNLALLSNAQSMIFPAKKQIWFQTGNAVVGDSVLVYDWSRRMFWYDTLGVEATAFTQDLSSAPPVPYAGDKNGQLYQMDIPGTDETPAIDFLYSTPWMSLGSPSDWKRSKWLFIAGNQQAVGSTLHVEIYTDFSIKAAPILEFDMSNQQFQVGLWKPINLRFKYIKVVITNSDQGVPVSIRWMRLDYVNEGPGL